MESEIIATELKSQNLNYLAKLVIEEIYDIDKSTVLKELYIAAVMRIKEYFREDTLKEVKDRLVLMDALTESDYAKLIEDVKFNYNKRSKNTLNEIIIEATTYAKQSIKEIPEPQHLPNLLSGRFR
jgi:hypothetical protein